jgi:hypothetical protein
MSNWKTFRLSPGFPETLTTEKRANLMLTVERPAPGRAVYELN